MIDQQVEKDLKEIISLMIMSCIRQCLQHEINVGEGGKVRMECVIVAQPEPEVSHIFLNIRYGNKNRFCNILRLFGTATIDLSKRVQRFPFFHPSGRHFRWTPVYGYQMVLERSGNKYVRG